jgi:O-antigen ligase
MAIFGETDTLASMATFGVSLRAIPQVCRDRALYLWAALATPPIAQFAHYLDPTTPLFKGHAAGVIFALVGLLLGVILWIPFRQSVTWPRLSIYALVLILMAWVYAVLRVQLGGYTFDLTAFCVPVVVLLIMIKPPNRRDVVGASLLFSYLLIASAMASLALDSAGLVGSGFDAAMTGYSRIPFIGHFFAIDTRWQGPFGNVNYAGPVGAFLIVYGATVKSWHRVILITCGVGIVLLSQARGAMFAMVAGLVVLLAYSPSITRLSRPWLARLLIFAGFVLAGTSYVGLFDKTLGGRTDVWRDYLGLWKESPWIGVGDGGVTKYVIGGDGGTSSLRHVHGHSVFIDILARDGVLMLALFIVALICTAIVAFQAAQIRQPVGLAILVFVIVAGLAETVYSMGYLSVNLVPLFIALFLSSSALAARQGPPHASPSLSNAV